MEIMIPRILLRRMEVVMWCSDYVIVDVVHICFCKNTVSGKRHFRHSQELAYGNAGSADLFTTTGSGVVVFRLCNRRCCTNISCCKK